MPVLRPIFWEGFCTNITHQKKGNFFNAPVWCEILDLCNSDADQAPLAYIVQCKLQSAEYLEADRAVETRTPETLEDFVTMADTYRVHAIGKESGHELSAELFERKNRWLGVPATVISAVVGSSIFASLASEKTSIVLMVVTGSLSICAAVLSALQTFLRYSETAQNHKTAAGSYGTLRRKIDLFMLSANSGEFSISDAREELRTIIFTLGDLEEKSLLIPDHLYDESTRRIQRRLARQSDLLESKRTIVFGSHSG